jgi:electron transfer flavoprotein beta subunit
MKVAVCVHRILDPEARLTVDLDGRLDVDGVTHVLDPVDGAAVEAAVQACEPSGGELVAISAGNGEETEAALRSALAQGAGRAVLVAGDAAQAGAVASRLSAAIEREGGIDLVICGATSTDYGGGATAATIAAALDMPVVHDVVAIGAVEDGRVAVTRRRDGGYRERLRVQLPAVLAVDRLAANPRFPTTQARLRANRAEIEDVAAAGSGIDEVSSAEPEPLFQPPPPKLHGIPWPSANLNARDRLRFLVQGGTTRAGGGGPVTGSADDVATAITSFLRDQGFIETANSGTGR